MKLGELLIMWIGGALVIVVLLSTVKIVVTPRQPFFIEAAANFPKTHIAVIVLICVMLWLTIYRRR